MTVSLCRTCSWASSVRVAIGTHMQDVRVGPGSGVTLNVPVNMSGSASVVVFG